jgi:hypothetical protein
MLETNVRNQRVSGVGTCLIRGVFVLHSFLDYLREFMKTIYVMFGSCFQLISTSSLKQFMKTACCLCENNLTLFYCLMEIAYL